MPTKNAPHVKRTKSTVQFDQRMLHLHTSILPLYLWMEKEYLLTIRANHHHVYWKHQDFKDKTEEIGSMPQNSKQSWNHSVTVFPFKPMTKNDNPCKVKLGVHVLLPVSPNGQDITNLVERELLTPGDTTNMMDCPQVDMNADIFTVDKINEEIEILEKLSKHKIVDAKSTIDFCEAIFEDDNKLECIIDGREKTLKFNNRENNNDENTREEFFDQYNNNPAACYFAIYNKFQKLSKMRFAMVDGQHRSLALFMRYCNLCPDISSSNEETTAMTCNDDDEYITNSGNTKFRGKNIDVEIGLKLLQLSSNSLNRKAPDQNDLVKALVQESEKVAISNKTLIGNSHVDRILKVCNDLQYNPISLDETQMILGFQNAEKYQVPGNKVMNKTISGWKKTLCRRVIENDNYIEPDKKK